MGWESKWVAYPVNRTVCHYGLKFGRKFLEVSWRADESSKTKVDDADYTKNVVIHDLQCERLYWTDLKILKFPISIFKFNPTVKFIWHTILFLKCFVELKRIACDVIQTVDFNLYLTNTNLIIIRAFIAWIDNTKLCTRHAGRAR